VWTSYAKIGDNFWKIDSVSTMSIKIKNNNFHTTAITTLNELYTNYNPHMQAKLREIAAWNKLVVANMFLNGGVQGDAVAVLTSLGLYGVDYTDFYKKCTLYEVICDKNEYENWYSGWAVGVNWSPLVHGTTITTNQIDTVAFIDTKQAVMVTWGPANVV
jgi:hypothetical protein